MICGLMVYAAIGLTVPACYIAGSYDGRWAPIPWPLVLACTVCWPVTWAIAFSAMWKGMEI